MHQGCGIVIGHVLGQPLHQMIHGGNVIGLRGHVLLGPAVALADVIVAGPAKTFQTHRLVIDTMKIRQNRQQMFIDGAAIFRRDSRGKLVIQDPAVHLVHDKKGGAQDRVILTQKIGFWDGHRRLAQGRHDAVFPVHRVGRGQQGAGRFLAQDILPAPGGHHIGRVGLTHGELMQGDVIADAVQVVGQVGA